MLFRVAVKTFDAAMPRLDIALYPKDDSILKHHKSMKRQSSECECGFICILTVQAEVSYLRLKF